MHADMQAWRRVNNPGTPLPPPPYSSSLARRCQPALRRTRLRAAPITSETLRAAARRGGVLLPSPCMYEPCEATRRAVGMPCARLGLGLPAPLLLPLWPLWPLGARRPLARLGRPSPRPRASRPWACRGPRECSSGPSPCGPGRPCPGQRPPRLQRRARWEAHAHCCCWTWTHHHHCIAGQQQQTVDTHCGPCQGRSPARPPAALGGGLSVLPLCRSAYTTPAQARQADCQRQRSAVRWVASGRGPYPQRRPAGPVRRPVPPALPQRRRLCRL